ncbi:helix-turn-helix domain-containing protein [Hamadaea sp. NPDC050747]|uniref:TetR/AcrR family transcriptional regulator n=1 Tax=Hamadaea sp. NPDC050747 TaxID=3155789 RepID=UPI0033CC47E8
MSEPVNTPKRPYHAPQRAAAATRTRQAVVAAGKAAFERHGWSGATMRGIGDEAGVSVKTVEALYRTKAELLHHVVDYAIAGDLRPISMLGRESVAAMTDAPDASAMLDLHARHIRSIGERAAAIFWVVEQAAPTHQDVAQLWARMNDNRRAGARWAATTLLAKPDVPLTVDQAYAEEVFWIAMDPGIYRSLTLGRGLSPAGFEAWARNFYRKMILN